MASPITPWDTSPRTSRVPGSNTGNTTSNATAPLSRIFGRNGTFTANGVASATRPMQVERAPIPIPLMGNSTARRLSKRAELLDKRFNTHVRATADSRPGDNGIPVLPELEGDTPVIAELEGSGPNLPELEGSTPAALFNAVAARVVPANTVKTVKVKAKRFSDRFFSLRPERTRYDVQCSNAAEDIAQAKQEMQEKRFLAEKLNACRRSAGVVELVMDEELCKHAQQHADNLPSPEDNNSIVQPSPGHTTNTQIPDFNPLPPRADTVTTVRSPIDVRCSVARIISERGLGAMACVERWYSGKLRRHAFDEIRPERHQEDCPCRLEIVYDTFMSPSFGKIGVGRQAVDCGQGGRVWVVELAA